jgi:hypothetical protein
MSAELPELFQAIDPGVIQEVARQSLGLPEFRLVVWYVTPLLHEKVIETTGGLFRFYGTGSDGSQTRAWSTVLKIVNQPEDECQQQEAMCYWRREMLAYQTGLLANLPPAVHAPTCFGVSEHTQGGWIWLENIQETAASPWTMDQYAYAARKLGQFQGAYLVGKPLPNHSWLCASLFRGFYADSDWWAGFINPASANNAWMRPLVQSVYSDQLQARVLQIWADKWQLIAANERLPQVFCHNDAHRRNLMLRENASGQQDLVAIDWSFCGPGALGNDLGELVGTTLSYFAVAPENAAQLEAAALQGYLSGLRDAGWSGEERLARLGYLLSLALYWGGTLPCEVAMAQPGEAKVNVEAKYGRALPSLLPGWTMLAEFALDRADEARYWIRQNI